ncbi:hypothetical protein CATMIT_01940, partial [Catenibacterium mitsuokai DSM 15897]
PGGGSHFWIDLPLLLEDGLGDRADAAYAADDKVISFEDPFLRHKTRVRSARVGRAGGSWRSPVFRVVGVLPVVA